MIKRFENFVDKVANYFAQNKLRGATAMTLICVVEAVVFMYTQWSFLALILLVHMIALGCVCREIDLEMRTEQESD